MLKECSTCRGTGYVIVKYSDNYHYRWMREKCPNPKCKDGFVDDSPFKNSC
jgi:hypothetical protein